MKPYNIFLILIIGVIYLISFIIKKNSLSQGSSQRKASNTFNMSQAVRNNPAQGRTAGKANALSHTADFMGFNAGKSTPSIQASFNRPQPQQGYMYLNGVYVAIKDADKLNFLK